MKKTIWIINQYASTPATGMGGRHFYLAQELAKQGHEVYLISSSYNHLLHKPQSQREKIRLEPTDGFTFVWVKVPEYREAHSNKRVLNWFVFCFRLLMLKSAIPNKPDAIICSSPSLISYLGAEYLAGKLKAKLIFEVRDIWPLTLTELGGVSPRHPFIRFLQWIEDRAYSKSDRVVSNLKNAAVHMVSRGMHPSKFSWIPNGYSEREAGKDVILQSSVMADFPKDKFIVGYAGTLGVANALDILILAAEILKDYTQISFVLIGNGKQKAELQNMVCQRNLRNVFFIDAIPKKQIYSAIARFDVCYIGWLKDELYRFGIGANKIPEYLFSARPILHSYSGGADPIKEAGAGLTVEAENPACVAEAVLKMYNMSPDERMGIGAAGRKEAINNYEYAALASKYSSIL